MGIKHSLSLIFILVVAATLYVIIKERPQKTVSCEGCNLIMIGIDDLRADRVGYYGYERELTPTLNSLAEDSYVFKNAITQAPWTLPSFMSLLTSTYPSQHKVMNKFYLDDNGEIKTSNLRALSPRITTLAETLRREGYATAGFTGDAGVGSEFGFDGGFDYYYDEDIFGGFEGSFGLAESWINENKDGKFFAFIHGYDCHGEFQLGYDKRLYSRDSNSIFNGTPTEEIKLRDRGLEGGQLDLSKSDLDFWKNLYDDKILNMDRTLSGFMRYLKDGGLMEKTVIVVVSDHGEEFMEHGKIDHGATLYDELLKVVLFIKLPESEGGIIDDQVRLVDVMPTILGLLSVKQGEGLREQMQGVSLTPLMRGEHLNLDAFSETDYRMFVSMKSIRTHDGWKLVIDPSSGRIELYDLNEDPGETKNVVGSEKTKYNELKEKLTYYSSIELNLSTHEKNTVNLDSKEFDKFVLNESFELRDKTVYVYNKDDEHLKIEKQDAVDEASAQKLRDNELIQIKAVFSDSISPYPGEISNEIRCAEEFKPIVYKTEVAGEERLYLTTYSNDRFGIGVCNQDLIKFRHLVGWVYCPKTKELYTVKYYTPPEGGLGRLQDFFIDLRCNN